MNDLRIENLSRPIEMIDSDHGVNRLIENQINQTGDDIEFNKSETKGFAELLGETIGKVNQDQVAADNAIKELVAGRTKNVHETMLTIEKADLSLKLMMQVRNKIIDAYREVMKMQV